jgi:hypothetical protein
MSATPRFSGDLAAASATLPHFWEHTIGSGHATLALREDWRVQMRRTHAEIGMRYVRFHGLLSDDMGTLIRQSDQLLYSFFNADQVFDFLLSIGSKHSAIPVRRRERGRRRFRRDLIAQWGSINPVLVILRGF